MAAARVLHLATLASSTPRVVRSIEQLQAIVQRDEGRRGIGPLTQPGQLLAVATELLGAATGTAAAASTSFEHARSVLVLTGFPCMRDRTPPAETDGPPGAASVARTLHALGVRVRLPIEEHSATVLRQCVEATMSVHTEDAPLVVPFPAADCWAADDDARLMALRTSAAALLCLERAGPASDGVCRTMRGLPMGPALVAPQLNSLAELAASGSPCRAATPPLRCVAIGDGGNELGLGELHPLICEHVANGAAIGCVVPAHAVLVASVSNWGGYALSHALALLAWDRGQPTRSCANSYSGRGAAASSAADSPPSAAAYLDGMAPDATAVRRAIVAANAAGAVDGITANAGGAVDGMPLEKQCAVVNELRETCLEHMEATPFGGGRIANTR